MTSALAWPSIENPEDVPSPALLIFVDRVAENMRRMIDRAGEASRLRPHVKTHKLPQIVQLAREHGIKKFKAATIAEAEMCAEAGAEDVLLAYQAVGPNVGRLVELVRKFPHVKFSGLIDDASALAELEAAATAGAITLDVLLDLDVGMKRTGVVPGPVAAALYHALARSPSLRPAGLHFYDGHLLDADPMQRARDAAAGFSAVDGLRRHLQAQGLPVPRLVGGGTTTFPFHAAREGIELGAGSCVFWDFGKAEKCPDLDFLYAAVLLTRVISRPAQDRLCLDLGHKAVASEMPHPRVKLLGLEEAVFVNHSEEHLVIETPRAASFPIGTVVYAIPRHVCSTVAMYSDVFAVRGARVEETWPVRARARRLSV